jgi:hypothetical protein
VDNQSIGAKYIVPVSILLMSPARHRWYSDKSISSGTHSGCVGLAQRDSKDIRRVWLQHDSSAITVKDEFAVLTKNCHGSDDPETKDPQHCRSDGARLFQEVSI